jgi:hypothetical protein
MVAITVMITGVEVRVVSQRPFFGSGSGLGSLVGVASAMGTHS